MSEREMNSLDRAADRLRDARRVAVLTGAGMSAECGVPTFREALTGLWARYDPHELATPEAFMRNPARVFGWYLWRLRLVRNVEPHAGYQALVRLGELIEDFAVVTQNVDGLHHRSGSREIVELHGSLTNFRCFDRRHPYPLEDVLLLAERSGDGDVSPPECAECGSAVRPGVVWFGEALPTEAVDRAWRAVERAEVVLVVGTSALVYPAADLPRAAQSAGAYVVEINPDVTPFSERADVVVREPAGSALPHLLDRLKTREPVS